jgi:hypothetical protein
VPPEKKVRLDDVPAGLAWGIFFSLAPVAEIIFLGAIAWVPLLVLLEALRSKRRGFLPGFLLRGTVAALVVLTAAAAPLKHEDRTRVGPLSANTLSLAALADELRPHHVSIEATDETAMLTFRSTRPSLRELIREVETKSSLRYDPRGCGNGMTILPHRRNHFCEKYSVDLRQRQTVGRPLLQRAGAQAVVEAGRRRPSPPPGPAPRAGRRRPPGRASGGRESWST